MPITRRDFIRWSAAAGTWVYVSGLTGVEHIARTFAAVPGGTLDPTSLPKFTSPLLIPPAMPRAGVLRLGPGKQADYYEISVRQFSQQILPEGFPETTVWGYGAVSSMRADSALGHNAPSFTIEAQAGRPVRIKWINDLVDSEGNYLPHLLPVDPTLHWANPPGGTEHRDSRPTFSETPDRYTGPVPIVTHLHGAVGVGDESDGYPEAWFLPRAGNIPASYAREGTWYRFFAQKARKSFGARWHRGTATFQYPNDNRASTLWYHDHTLGMTRVNVYAGPAGFYLIRGGPSDRVINKQTGRPARLPGPSPRDIGRGRGRRYYEIPIAIQDRAFNTDGSLFYPDAREFFDGIVAPLLPQEMGFSPIWNPEFFGNALIANGKTWPYMTTEKRRYRFRLLNGCQSRFLILDFNDIPDVEVWQIGNDGGYLAEPVDVTTLGNRILLGPAERADVIVDFTNVPVGRHTLRNVAPDEPFGGGEPDVDFPAADTLTTGMVMQFDVVPAISADMTTRPADLVLPTLTALGTSSRTRPLAAIEMMGMGEDASGNMVEGPLEALLGTVENGNAIHKMWMDPVTENPKLGATEIWEFYNTTGDAHPLHVHEVAFEIVNRQALELDVVTGAPIEPLTPIGATVPPEPGESGVKDTVIAYPGQVTRVKARFKRGGQFVWHCHILEHEDNEMMRPFRIGPMQPGEPGTM